MTKLRPPLSFEQALTVVAGHLGWSEAAELIGKKERTVRDYGDPDVATSITIDDAYTLDRAYQAAGGEGAPFHQCYTFRLGAEAAVPGLDPAALSRLAASAAIEGGQAIAALIAASRPDASPADIVIAKREVEQAMGVLSNTLPLLDDVVSSPVRVTPRGGATA